MRILINYADERFQKAQKMNTWSGRVFGRFNKIYSFGPNDIEKVFYQEHREILNQKRGGGLWLWKPYFINRVLNECADGDYVFYCDSGAIFIRNVKEVIDSMSPTEDVWISDNPLLECCFTKKECFTKMGCKGERYEKTNQIQATYLLLRCSDASKAFIQEWLNLCCDKDLIWPETNINLVNDNPYQFIAHREDQSILSLLSKKKGISVHRDPSQRGFVQETFRNSQYAFVKTVHNDRYRTILFLHKSATVNLFHCVKIIVNSLLLHWKPDGKFQI